MSSTWWRFVVRRSIHTLHAVTQGFLFVIICSRGWCSVKGWYRVTDGLGDRPPQVVRVFVGGFRPCKVSQLMKMLQRPLPLITFRGRKVSLFLHFGLFCVGGFS